jgi:hypothetical protein
LASPVKAGRRRQLAVLDVYQLARVLGDGRGAGDDHRHRLTDVAHALQRQHRVMRLAHLLSVTARIVDDVGQRLEAGAARVLPREHRHHAGMRQCPRRVQAQDFGMRAISAQEHRVQLAGQIPVGGVAPLAGDEPQILAARHGDLLGRHARAQARPSTMRMSRLAPSPSTRRASA